MAEIRGVLRKCKRATPNTGPNTLILPVITLEKLLLFFFNYSTYAKGVFYSIALRSMICIMQIIWDYQLTQFDDVLGY